MVKEGKDRKVNTDVPVADDQGKRLPHERDESPEGSAPKPRSVIEQAASDTEQGLVDTDLHGTPGLQKPAPEGGAQAKPLPGTKRD
jgi:hypothetical protein